MKKVILSFSGGLDTSFSVPYLKEQGFDVVTVTIDTGGFTKLELKEIAKKSKTLGAIKHYEIDGKKQMFEKIISYIIKTNGLYEQSYPNMCTDRYIIAEETIKIAKKEKAQAIAHGSSGMGNDQVRFDISLMTLAPEFQIITPIKEIGGDRKYEEEYLQQRGFLVSTLHKKYSVNQNILGITYSGSEIDELQEPDEEMFQWTKRTKTKTTYLTLGFEKGVPTLLNGEKLSGIEILKKLNTIVGAYGYGQDFVTNDCVIGIKGHIAFEAPGILTIIKAHTALQKLILTKDQQIVGQFMNDYFTNLLYSGKFYEPVVTNLKAFIDSEQQYVTGTVKVKLTPHQVQTVALSSPYSLINPKIGTYAQKGEGATWTSQDAEGFIKLYGLQLKISASIKNHTKGGA